MASIMRGEEPTETSGSGKDRLSVPDGASISVEPASRDTDRPESPAPFTSRSPEGDDNAHV